MTSAPAKPKKTCGACTLCCKLFAIPSLDKPGDVWCSHCKPGSGCGIYGSHPRECQTFACQWLRFEDMPDAYRPDRTKVVLCIESPGEQLVARCDTAAPMAWRNEPIYGFLKRYAQGAQGTALRVLARTGDRAWLITPTQDVDLGFVVGGASLMFAEDGDGQLQVTVGPVGHQV